MLDFIRRLFFRPCGRQIDVGERFAYTLAGDYPWAALCLECGRRRVIETRLLDYKAAKTIRCGMSKWNHPDGYAVQ